MLSVVERKRSLRMCLAVAVLLVQHEILHTQQAELGQRAFLLRGVRVFTAFGLGVCHDLFKIRGHDQTSAFLVNLRDAVTEWRRSKTAHIAVAERDSNTLQL